MLATTKREPLARDRQMTSDSPTNHGRVAYLTNQYPSTSHTFVRREICALEAMGIQVDRYSIRPFPEPQIEPADQLEASQTHVLLNRGAKGLIWSCLAVLARNPLRFVAGFALVCKLARFSDRGFIRPFAWLAEACLLKRLIARSGARHVHAHFGTNSAAVAMLANALGGPSYSFTSHGTESFDSPPTISLSLKIARARFVVAVSEWGRTQLMRWCSSDSWHKLHVVRCGLDDQFLGAPMVPPPTTPRLICVSRLSPEKGVEILIAAVEQLILSGTNVELVLVGDGPSRGPIEARLKNPVLKKSVHLLGWGDAARVRKEMLAARALIVPSLAEGLPVVIMEAFALCRPVVATAVGAVAELVENRETGWLVAPGSPSSLAAAIQQVLAASQEELFALGKNGAQRVKERHTVADEARVLAGLLANRSPT
ncbi:MAG: colanic acid/amylovoran biosynthesis glycosyltransferase [Planctomycetota bacterium]|jgi:colanic acid/amylovoran biosynthesis glycosyltransferase